MEKRRNSSTTTPRRRCSCIGSLLGILIIVNVIEADSVSDSPALSRIGDNLNIDQVSMSKFLWILFVSSFLLLPLKLTEKKEEILSELVFDTSVCQLTAHIGKAFIQFVQAIIVNVLERPRTHSDKFSQQSGWTRRRRVGGMRRNERGKSNNDNDHLCKLRHVAACTRV